jgi:hypothetical protein
MVLANFSGKLRRATVIAVPPPTQPFTKRRNSCPRGRSATDILATSDLSTGSSTVTLAEKRLDAAVFLTQARIASITSGMRNSCPRGRTETDILATSDFSTGSSTVTLAEKSLDAPAFFDASAHSFYRLWNAVVYLAAFPSTSSLMKSPA